MKAIFYLLILVCGSFNLSAENEMPVSVKLPTNNVIGTAISVDYDNGSKESTTVNTRHNAFDGDLNTIFASYVRSGGWIGLDLGEKYVITKITYCPRESRPERLVLGVFEGANNPDFGDAFPLYIVTENPLAGKLTQQMISCSKGFRYVRYIGPSDQRCNIAEIEFYGYKGDGDHSNLYRITNLPTISIHTANAEDIVEKEKYLKGIVTIIAEDGTTVFQDSLEIKGRGNNSWTHPKKPYRMKLMKKAQLLGLPSNEKNWTLINNYGDKTLMRNLLAFDMSKRMEMPYTSAGKPVDVLLNGEYKGTYQLCDQMEVKPTRVDIDEMEVSDISGEKLTGGYLLEIDAYADQELPIAWFRSARNSMPVTIKSPKDDEIVQAQRNYIIDHFNKMEASLFSFTYLDPINGYRKYIHTPTFIRHFLLGEFCGNTDTYWSVYTYKKRNDDLFYFGPIWDFDLAYENDKRTYPINDNSDWIYNSEGSSVNGMKDFVNQLFSDPDFVNEVKSIYAKYRDLEIISEAELLKVVDDYAVLLNQSQNLNFKRWDIMNSIVHENPKTYGSYEGEINNVKNYVKNRLVWMDNKLKYTPPISNMDVSNRSGILVKTQKNGISLQHVDEPITVRIFDVSGRLIKSHNLKTDDFIYMEPGIYVVCILDESGRQDNVKCAVL